MGLLMTSTAMGAGTGGAESGGRLLHRIDCTQDYPPERYFTNCSAGVVESGAGRYREGGPKAADRFGYRFSVERVGKPHVAVIRYPDDKRRYMCVMDSTTYDLSTGLFTNWAQPLSGAMHELRQIFWPRWRDCSVVFMSWGEGEPAAAASVEIWELDELAPLALPAKAPSPRRELGIQYEDPCGTGAAEGAMNREQWLDHLTEYALHSGQGLLVYPMVWYHGPAFPSEREPSGALDMAVARDRNQYLRWTTHPEDWYARLLKRFGQKGLKYRASLTMMRLGSLMQKMNTDIAAIKGGADTINNMNWNDHVQGSTGDWTPLYNVRNFNEIAKLVKQQGRVEPFGSKLPPFAYGETPDPANPMSPIFNPLHPVVQEALTEFVREIGARYAKYPAFEGVSFNMYASCMPWFGSIRSGYDDLTIGLFEKETGIHLPVDAKAPDRFSKRYDYLTRVCRAAWVDWRCRKVRDLFVKMSQALAAARPDLDVVITLWDETTIPGVLGMPLGAHQLYARQSNVDFFRDAGIDMALYRDVPGIRVDTPMGNSRDRGGHGAHSAGGVNTPIEEATMYRDFDYLDQESLDAAHAHAKPGAFIFNCWVEAWGKHVWSWPEPGDPNARELGMMDGKPAEGLLRINSEYPKDGFWWDSQLRITPGFPGGPHFLEPYAHAVAELDACRITRGGLFLDKAHTEAIQQFARAYRALPGEKFETVGATTDPVAVRTLQRDGVRYLYLVNRDYYPVNVEVTFNAAPKEVQDLSTGKKQTASDRWALTLGPYELRSYSLESNAAVAGFTTASSPDIVAQLTKDAESAFKTFADVRARSLMVPGLDTFEARMRAALTERRWAWLRRALTSYIVRKSRELSAK